MKKLGHLGIDQYGQEYTLGMYPRKELKEKYCLTGKIYKMYCDTTSGAVREKGYVIGKLWITLYSVYQWKNSPDKSTNKRRNKNARVSVS